MFSLLLPFFFLKLARERGESWSQVTSICLSLCVCVRARGHRRATGSIAKEKSWSQASEKKQTWGWWVTEKQVRKVEKLSQQFLLASWHSCSVSENLEAFSAVHFVSEVLQRNSITKHHPKRHFSVFYGSADAGTEVLLSWKENPKRLCFGYSCNSTRQAWASQELEDTSVKSRTRNSSSGTPKDQSLIQASWWTRFCLQRSLGYGCAPWKAGFAVHLAS